MQINPSPKIRATLYIAVVLGTAIIVPLNAGGVINNLVLAVWTSVSGAVSALAAFNVTKN